MLDMNFYTASGANSSPDNLGYAIGKILYDSEVEDI